MLCLIGLTLETVKTRTRRGNAPRETASGTTGAVLFFLSRFNAHPSLFKLGNANAGIQSPVGRTRDVDGVHPLSRAYSSTPWFP